MTLPVVVNSYATGTASTSLQTVQLTQTLSSVSNGKLIAICAINTSDDVTDVQSDIGGAFSLLGSELCTESSSNLRLAIFELLNPAAGAHTITATRSASGTTVKFYMVLVHVSGAAQVTSTIDAGTNAVTDSATFNDAITTTAADSLVIAACAGGGAVSGSTTSVSPGAGQTNLKSLIGSTTTISLTVDSINAATAGALTPSWTWDTSQRRAAMYSLSIPPAGAVAARPSMLMLLGVG